MTKNIKDGSYRAIKALPKWIDPEELRKKEEALAALAAKNRKSTRRGSAFPGSDRNAGNKKMMRRFKFDSFLFTYIGVGIKLLMVSRRYLIS